MRRGFSLIELMVVIAIVALLSAVAVPAYQNYIAKAKISNAIQYMQARHDQSIKQSINNGETVATISNIFNAAPNLYWYMVSTQSGTCPNGVYQAMINGFSDDGAETPPNGVTLFYANFFVETPGGMIKSYCMYYVAEDSGPPLADPGYLPECSYDPNQPQELVDALVAC